MIRIAVVEDNKVESEKLKGFLERILPESDREFDIRVFYNATDFLNGFNRSEYELLFMDIQLPDVNGMEVCRRVRQSDERITIVFVTSMAQCAIEGYEVEAADFLVKPISFEGLALKMKRIMRFVDLKRSKKIALEFKGSTVYLDETEVIYIEVIKHYLIYHTAAGDYTLRGSMKEAQRKVSRKFSRCATSYLANLEYVEEIKANRIAIRGKGKTPPAVIPLTRNFKKSFTKALYDYVSGGEALK